MEEKSHIYIVCSDQTRNGKTLFARLLSDFLLVSGGSPFIMDLDAPIGNICEYYPERSEVYDISTVAGQMEVFDWILGTPGRDYVIDVPARFLEKFFTVMDDIDFIGGAFEQGFDLNVFYLVEGTGKSLDQALMMHDNYSVDRFFVIRHQAMDEDLKDFNKLSTFHDIAGDGQIVLPPLNREVLDCVEARDFSFADFISGEEIDMPPKAQFQLASYLENVIDAIGRIKRRIDIGNLTRMDTGLPSR